MLRAGATIKDDMYFFGASLEKGGGKGNPACDVSAPNASSNDGISAFQSMGWGFVS